MRLSQDFLADLQAVAATLPEPSISPFFLDDLVTVHESLLKTARDQLPSDDELGFVADHLQEWRAQTEEALAKLIGRLPEDDPLRCPISLFAAMDYGRLEAAHTRVLAWLLDPRKEHGFGSKLLEALLNSLLERDERRPLPIVVEQVESEFLIDQPGKTETTGRIDVFAKGVWVDHGQRLAWLLVIEVKIDALEGDEQLTRYEDWLDSHSDNREVLRVFLTSDGRLPETAEQDWLALKFQELVESFRAVSDELRDKPGYHFLRFYLAGVLRDVCGWPLPIRSECDDPYSILDYLKHVLHR